MAQRVSKVYRAWRARLVNKARKAIKASAETWVRLVLRGRRVTMVTKAIKASRASLALLVRQGQMVLKAIKVTSVPSAREVPKGSRV